MKKEDLEKYSVYEAIEYVKGLEPACLSRPRKPTLQNGANSKYVMQYGELLRQFELDIADYEIQQSKNREQSRKLTLVLEDFIKDQSGLLDYVPKDKQDKVWNYAWQQGHSSGYNEVYNYLQELVELFE